MSSKFRWVIFVVATAVVIVSGCSGDTEATGAVESPSAERPVNTGQPVAEEATPTPRPTVKPREEGECGPKGRDDVDEWVEFLGETFVEMAAGLEQVHAEYEWEYGLRLTNAEAELEAIRAEAMVLRSAEFPGEPVDDALTCPYRRVLDAAESWEAGFTEAANDLEAAIGTANGEGDVPVGEIVDHALRLPEGFGQACEETLMALAEIRAHELTCPTTSSGSGEQAAEG